MQLPAEGQLHHPCCCSAALGSEYSCRCYGCAGADAHFLPACLPPPQWYAEAEKTNGRWAMAAVAGILFTEILGKAKWFEVRAPAGACWLCARVWLQSSAQCLEATRLVDAAVVPAVGAAARCRLLSLAWQQQARAPTSLGHLCLHSEVATSTG